MLFEKEYFKSTTTKIENESSATNQVYYYAAATIAVNGRDFKTLEPNGVIVFYPRTGANITWICHQRVKEKILVHLMTQVVPNLKEYKIHQDHLPAFLIDAMEHLIAEPEHLHAPLYVKDSIKPIDFDIDKLIDGLDRDRFPHRRYTDTEERLLSFCDTENDRKVSRDWEHKILAVATNVNKRRFFREASQLSLRHNQYWQRAWFHTSMSPRTDADAYMCPSVIFEWYMSFLQGISLASMEESSKAWFDRCIKTTDVDDANFWKTVYDASISQISQTRDLVDGVTNGNFTNLHHVHEWKDAYATTIDQTDKLEKLFACLCAVVSDAKSRDDKKK